MDHERARKAHDNMPEDTHMDAAGPSIEFRNAVHKRNEKQRAFEGDRSHPRLVALDRLSETLSYPGWEQDVKNCEETHFQNYCGPTTSTGCGTIGGDMDDVYFQSKLEGLQNRQQLYFGTQARDENDAAGAACSAQHKITGLLGPCIICGEREKTHLFDPCGHLCACQSCADTVMRSSLSNTSPGAPSLSSCPVCRVPAHKVIRVYFS